MQTALRYNRLELRRLLPGLGLLVGLMVAAVTAQAQMSIFMRIGGQAAAINTTQTAPQIPGDSLDAQYPKWIQVLSISHGITLPVNTSGGVSSTGTPQHEDVSVAKMMDSSSPSLELLVNGSASGLPVNLPIDYVTLDFRTGGGGTTSPVVFYRIELQDVYLTSYSVGASSQTPSENVSLKYSKIRWTYVPYSSGKAGTPITKGWDLTKNAAF